MNKNEFLKDLPNLTNRIGKRLCMLGEGGEGIVALHELNSETEDQQKKKVAVKTVPCYEKSAEEKIQTLRKEALILHKIKHSNIIQYYGSIAENDVFSIVLEYHRHKSLMEFIEFGISPKYDDQTRYEQSWMWSLKKQLLSEIINGLFYLHENQILHLDIKPSNILVDKNLHAKISDFGCAISNKQKISNKVVRLTYPYAAPERIKRNKDFAPTNKCDIYSFAMLSWTLITEKTPFNEFSHLSAFYEFQVVKNKQRPCLISIANLKMKKIIEKCWNHEPKKRLTSKGMLNTLGIPLFIEHGNICSESIKAEIKKTSTKNLELQKKLAFQMSDLDYSHAMEYYNKELTRDKSFIYSTVQKTYIDENVNNTAELLPVEKWKNTWEKLKPSGSTKKCYVSILIGILVLVSLAIGLIQFRHTQHPVLQNNKMMRLFETNHCKKTKLMQQNTAEAVNKMNCSYNRVALDDFYELTFFPNGTKCSMPCLDKQKNEGSHTVTCVGTEWKSEHPKCIVKRCLPLDPPYYSIVTCNKGNTIGSTCSYQCQNGYKGSANITCKSSLQWSGKPPVCTRACPHCHTGDYCSLSNSWKKLTAGLSSTVYVPFKGNYAGHNIICDSRLRWEGFLYFTFRAKCVDQKTSTTVICGHFHSPRGSMEHALAALIKKLIKEKVYPKPCEPSALKGLEC